MSKAEAPLRIIVDTREQRPFDFTRYAVEVVRVGLPAGDYSLPGFEDRAAVERKSVDDLLGYLTVGRDRFERELAHLRHYELLPWWSKSRGKTWYGRATAIAWSHKPSCNQSSRSRSATMIPLSCRGVERRPRR